MERRWREAAAVPEDGLSTEDRITRDMLQVVAEAWRSRPTTSRYREIQVVDQIRARRRCSRS